ncbi:phage tail family protein, partial [Escherichia coli 94.0618]
GGRRSGER